MIDVEIGNETYVMPTNWNEVSIGTFQRVMELNNIYKDYRSDVLFSLDVFSILLKVDRNVLKKMDQGSFKTLSEELKWVMDNEAIQLERKDEIIINNQKYIFPDNLDSLSMGELISIELGIKDLPQSEVLLHLLAILLRPVKQVKKKDGIVEVISDFDDEYADNLEKVKDLYRENIMVSEVLHIQNFFLDGGK